MRNYSVLITLYQEKTIKKKNLFNEEICLNSSSLRIHPAGIGTVQMPVAGFHRAQSLHLS